MAEVILNLPLGRSKPKSRYHDLFLQITDGKIWKVNRAEFIVDPKNLQMSLRAWAKHRKMRVKIHNDAEGNVFVQRIQE